MEERKEMMMGRKKERSTKCDKGQKGQKRQIRGKDKYECKTWMKEREEMDKEKV